MKTKFLFSTLALSAALVACNNEEIVVNESVDANEIVGAKLLGNGLTMGIGAEAADSRATAEGWENGDVAGIAWVTKDGATTSQEGVSLSEGIESDKWQCDSDCPKKHPERVDVSEHGGQAEQFRDKSKYCQQRQADYQPPLEVS
jgi:hypothetical protein